MDLKTLVLSFYYENALRLMCINFSCMKKYCNVRLCFYFLIENVSLTGAKRNF